MACKPVIFYFSSHTPSPQSSPRLRSKRAPDGSVQECARGCSQTYVREVSWIGSRKQGILLDRRRGDVAHSIISTEYRNNSTDIIPFTNIFCEQSARTVIRFKSLRVPVQDFQWLLVRDLALLVGSGYEQTVSSMCLVHSGSSRTPHPPGPETSLPHLLERAGFLDTPVTSLPFSAQCVVLLRSSWIHRAVVARQHARLSHIDCNRRHS